MRILIAASGSYGDVYPFVGLARELRLRGHEIVFFANDYFRAAVEAEQLQFIAVGEASDYESIVHDPRLWDAKLGVEVVLEAVMRFTPPAYELLLQEYRAGETLLVGSSLSFAARLLQETKDARLVTVHLAPSVFRSALDPIHLPNASIPAAAPAWAKSGFWWLADRFALDPLVVPAMNALRTELGLSPIRRLFDRWIHSPDRVIGLFPDWFAARREDWPAQTRLTGFPLYDAVAHEVPPDELETFLRLGPAPVLLTPGTANASGREFFEVSLSACAEVGSRALLVTRYADQVPTPLPEWAAHFDYLPFSAVLARCRAFVHHGGIGSLSQGFLAGVPQLIRPIAFDQFDNASRAVDLGVARAIPSTRYSPDRVTTALDALGSSAVRESCRNVAQHFRDDAGLSDAATLIEALQSPQCVSA